MNIPDNHPLLLTNLKAQNSAAQYLGASVGVVDGYGSRGAKPRPFRYDLAVKKFSSWVYKAGMLNAKAFASVPLRLYARRKSVGTKLYQTRPVSRSRQKYLFGECRDRPSETVLRKVADFGTEFEEVTEPHPALQVLASVNPWQNGFELSMLRCLYWQFTGNAYLHTVMDRALSRPAELWLMPSQWVEIIPDRSNFIAGYIYGRKPDTKQFATDEVIQWKLPSLDNLYYGKGWVEALWSAIGLHDGKRIMDTARVDNMGRPDWLLVVKQGGTTALDRIEAEVTAKLQGPHKSGQMLAVSGDVTATALNLDEIDFGDPDKLIEEIAAVADVPLHKLRGNDPVKANSENADVGWMRDTILPYCRMDEEVLNAKYLPLFGIGNDAVLAYDNPVPENEVAQVDMRVKAAGGPYRLVNEVRAEAGDEPIDGGDVMRSPPTDPMAAIGAALGATMPKPGEMDKPGGVPASQIETTQTSVLNGAQVTAATAIVVAVAAGEIPRDSGIGQLEVLFNLSREQAERIMGTAGTNKPTTPNPNPAREAELASQAAKPDNQNQGKSSGHEPIGDGRRNGVIENPLPAARASTVGGAPGSGEDGAIASRAAQLEESAAGEKNASQSAKTASRVVIAKSATFASHKKTIATIMQRVFAEQRAAVMAGAGIKTKAAEPDTQRPSRLPDAFISLDKWTPEIASEVQPVIELIGSEQGAALLTRVGASPDAFAVFNREWPKAAEKLALEFSAETNATTSMQLETALAKLRTEIADGLVEGDKLDEMTKRVEEVFDQADESRAETIARTESTRAANQGELAGAKESKVVSRKIWLASGDACPICEALAAEHPEGVPLDAEFAPGVDAPPDSHPNCECSMTYSVNDPDDEPETE